MFVALRLTLVAGILSIAKGFQLPKYNSRFVARWQSTAALNTQFASLVDDLGSKTVLPADAAAATILFEGIKDASNYESMIQKIQDYGKGDLSSLSLALLPLIGSSGQTERVVAMAQSSTPSAHPRESMGDFEDRALDLMARDKFLEAHDVCAGFLSKSGDAHGVAAHGAVLACELLEGICQAKLACIDGLSEALVTHGTDGPGKRRPGTLPCGCAAPSEEAVEPFLDLARAFYALEIGQTKSAFGYALVATLAHPALFTLSRPLMLSAGAIIEESLVLASKLETTSGLKMPGGVDAEDEDEEAVPDMGPSQPSLKALSQLVGLTDIKERCANLCDAIELDRERGDDLANAPFALDVHEARMAGARLAMDFGARRTSATIYAWDPASMWVQPTTITTYSKDLEDIEEAVELTGSQYSLGKTKSYSLVLTGSPGTGKSTVAKLYAAVLGDLAVMPEKRMLRITGSALEEDGIQGLEKMLRTFDRSFAGRAPNVGDLVEAQFEGIWGHVGRVVRQRTYETDMGSTKFFGVDFGHVNSLTFRNGTSIATDQSLTLELPSNSLKSLSERGGVLIIDDAHQLDPTSSKAARQVLDRLGEEMDEWGGDLAVVLAGYEKQIEDKVLAHGGLASRFPRHFKLPDFNDEELVELLKREFQSTKPKYHVTDEKYLRIAARRVGKGRGSTGFGNARAIQALLDLSSERQTQRVVAARKVGNDPDIFEFTRNDFLGAPPALLSAESSAPLRELLQMEGLASVKASVNGLLQVAESNAEREELELAPAELSLNRVFLGNPGTGKTTVARLYGLILKELGLLSRGDVVLATPADLVGSALGASEERTNALLDKSEGCVLVIDEAYGLDPSGGGLGGPSGSGSGGGGGDPYRTAVVDTLVSRVSGDAGADRCVLLLGYRKEMERFLRRGNPGLARRFQLENAFEFEDFDDQVMVMFLQSSISYDPTPTFFSLLCLTSSRNSIPCRPSHFKPFLLNVCRQALLRILFANVANRGRTVSFPTAKAAVRKNLAKGRLRPHFGNAGAVDNLVSSAVSRAEERLQKLPATLRAVENGLELSDFIVEKPHVANPSLVFQGLIGCETIKNRLAEYQAVVEAATAAGRDPTDDLALTFCFQGSPGTGKTTVAKRMGLLFESLGVLPTSEVVTVSASQLSSGFVGQTASKTRDVFDSARGAVLFIDEAYRLHDPAGRSYMQEAVDEIVNLLTEPEYRGRMVVIFAGYILPFIVTNLDLRFP